VEPPLERLDRKKEGHSCHNERDADQVNGDINRAGGATADKSLMEFVAARIHRTEQERPEERRFFEFGCALLNGADGKQRQYCILRDVRRFAENDIDNGERCPRDSAGLVGRDDFEQAMDQRIGVIAVTCPRGRKKDDAHPEDERRDIENFARAIVHN